MQGFSPSAGGLKRTNSKGLILGIEGLHETGVTGTLIRDDALFAQDIFWIFA